MNATLKILQIGPYPPPATGWSVRIKILKRYLERQGHICRVLNTNKNRRTRSSEFIAIDGAIDYFFKVLGLSAAGYLIHMHINGKSTKSPALALIAELIARLFFRPAVLTFHAGAQQDYFPRQNKFWLDNIFRLIFLLAGKIICNNEEVKARIVEYGIRPEKIIPIPAFCLEYLEDKSELPDNMSRFLKTHSPSVCSYVYLRHDFNIEFFLRSLKKARERWPNLGVVLMGADRESEMLEDMLKQHGLQDNAFVAGDLEHGIFLSVLEACQAYIRTPIVDGVSSSVLEALALGTPVVASENGSRPNGVVTYRDGYEDSFMTAMEMALPLKREKNGKASHNLQEIATELGVRDTLREEVEVLRKRAER